jgi:hypothetical protein
MWHPPLSTGLNKALNVGGDQDRIWPFLSKEVIIPNSDAPWIITCTGELRAQIKENLRTTCSPHIGTTYICPNFLAYSLK